MVFQTFCLKGTDSSSICLSEIACVPNTKSLHFSEDTGLDCYHMRVPTNVPSTLWADSKSVMVGKILFRLSCAISHETLPEKTVGKPPGFETLPN